MKNEERLKIIINNTEIINWLRAIKKADMPDAWLVGGALRNTVWKNLFGEECKLEVNDIDVPYFSKDLGIEYNKFFVEKLESIYQTGKWECDNQAWVHTYEPKSNYCMPNAPYNSLDESMIDFWFSVNTIGVRLNKNGDIEIKNPQALDDLFNGVLRILPFQKNNPHPWFEEKINKITSRCSNIKVI